MVGLYSTAVLPSIKMQLKQVQLIFNTIRSLSILLVVWHMRFGIYIYTYIYIYMCVRVCVVIPFILDVRLVDAPAGVTQEEGHTGFLHLPSAVLALVFIARRIRPSLPSLTVKSNVCTHEIIVLHLLGMM